MSQQQILAVTRLTIIQQVRLTTVHYINRLANQQFIILRITPRACSYHLPPGKAIFWCLLVIRPTTLLHTEIDRLASWLAGL